MPGRFCQGNGATGAAGQGSEHRQPPAKGWEPWWGGRGCVGSRFHEGGRGAGRGAECPGWAWHTLSIRLPPGPGQLTHLPRWAPGTKRALPRKADPHPHLPVAGCSLPAQDASRGRGRGGGREEAWSAPQPLPCPLDCLPSQAAANPYSIFRKGDKEEAIGGGGGREIQVPPWKLISLTRS